jgi:hypothetical protein
MDNLLKCVEALKDVRRCLHSDADPSIVTALDAVIDELQRCATDREPDPLDVAQVAFRALALLGEILACLSAAAELVTRFRS